jgi:hypothetical protein
MGKLDASLRMRIDERETRAVRTGSNHPARPGIRKIQPSSSHLANWQSRSGWQDRSVAGVVGETDLLATLQRERYISLLLTLC